MYIGLISTPLANCVESSIASPLSCLNGAIFFFKKTSGYPNFKHMENMFIAYEHVFYDVFKNNWSGCILFAKIGTV